MLLTTLTPVNADPYIYSIYDVNKSYPSTATIEYFLFAAKQRGI